MPGIRPDLEGLVPYDPDMRDVEVMLSANENSFGLPDLVRVAVRDALEEVNLHRYPFATAPQLRRELADIWGLSPQNVVVANGGDELLFNIALAFGGPGRALINCPPTFSAYALYAQLTGTDLVDVARCDDFSLDEEALLLAAASPEVSIIVVTSPNNPTGNVVRPDFVERLAEITDALVLVDEAYGEFAPPEASCVPLLATHPNIAVLRTLSKAYALAGARVGYVLAAPEVIDVLLAVRLPYSVSSLDQAAALAVVRARDTLADSVSALIEGRHYLASALKKLPGLCVYPSEANFLLIRFANAQDVPSAHDVHERLAREYSILVRDVSAQPYTQNCLRITVGTPSENERLVQALTHILCDS